ncbi:MAG: 4'-phosphopantetheinyl transferase superfamily protein [Treponema sp.]|jgi:phosphopantetheinyl transferase|nr:4'-phosphopantetheinyl transferase superfamily protein [Treponema sp.]
MQPFYIGLSRLSTLAERYKDRAGLLRNEARRILRLLDGDCPAAIENGGRPFFPDAHADFSISHSRNMAAVALLPNPFYGHNTGGGPPSAPRTGCDIQYAAFTKPHGGISRNYFHASERSYIEAARGEEHSRRFYRLWVLKESWIKLRGASVFEIAHAPVFTITGDERKIVTASMPAPDAAPLQAAFFLYEIEAAPDEWYMLAAAREGDTDGQAEPEIRWF